MDMEYIVINSEEHNSVGIIEICADIALKAKQIIREAVETWHSIDSIEVMDFISEKLMENDIEFRWVENISIITLNEDFAITYNSDLDKADGLENKNCWHTRWKE